MPGDSSTNETLGLRVDLQESASQTENKKTLEIPSGELVPSDVLKINTAEWGGSPNGSVGFNRPKLENWIRGNRTSIPTSQV